MDIIIFILALSVLVIIHELGHFLAARRFGVKVEEFGVGYPPRAKVLKTDKRGTIYSLNWLPIGGFVRLYGEEGAEAGETTLNPKEAFYLKPVKQRLPIIAAGVIVNFVFGVLIFAGLYTYLGISQGLPQNLGYVKVSEVSPGSPAQTAGLVAGDQVVAVKTAKGTIAVTNSNQFISVVNQNAGGQIILVLKDPDRELPVYVRTKAEIPAGQGSIGVVITDYTMVHYPLWQMPFRGMVVGVQSALDLGWLILTSLGSMVNKLFTQGQVPTDVAGPVGIAYIATKERLFSQGFVTLLNFTAMLSINLAIINILPIPPLDGGRAVMLLYEGVTRRRVDAALERRVLAAGMIFFLTLIVLISIKDIGQIVTDIGLFRWLLGK
jgi:regulator of sigma E protease